MTWVFFVIFVLAAMMTEVELDTYKKITKPAVFGCLIMLVAIGGLLWAM